MDFFQNKNWIENEFGFKKVIEITMHPEILLM